MQDEKPIKGRPSDNMQAPDLEEIRAGLTESMEAEPTETDIINFLMYPIVSGEFNAPTLFLGGSHNEKTVMKFVFKAQAEFSIEEGKWVSYNGIMAFESSGVMTSSQKQKFALIER